MVSLLQDKNCPKVHTVVTDNTLAPFEGANGMKYIEFSGIHVDLMKMSQKTPDGI